MAGVAAGDDARRRRYHGTYLRQPDPVAELGDAALHGVGGSVGQVGGGGRAGSRVHRDADRAVAAKMHAHAPEAACVGRHRRPDAVEHAHQRRGASGGLGQVEAVG